MFNNSFDQKILLIIIAIIVVIGIGYYFYVTSEVKEAEKLENNSEPKCYIPDGAIYKPVPEDKEAYEEALDDKIVEEIDEIFDTSEDSTIPWQSENPTNPPIDYIPTQDLPICPGYEDSIQVEIVTNPPERELSVDEINEILDNIIGGNPSSGNTGNTPGGDIINIGDTGTKDIIVDDSDIGDIIISDNSNDIDDIIITDTSNDINDIIIMSDSGNNPTNDYMTEVFEKYNNYVIREPPSRQLSANEIYNIQRSNSYSSMYRPPPVTSSNKNNTITLSKPNTSNSMNISHDIGSISLGHDFKDDFGGGVMIDSFGSGRNGRIERYRNYNMIYPGVFIGKQPEKMKTLKYKALKPEKMFSFGSISVQPEKMFSYGSMSVEPERMNNPSILNTIPTRPKRFSNKYINHL